MNRPHAATVAMVALSVACLPVAAASPPQASPAPEIPDAGGKLAVVILVDGLGAGDLERWRPWLSRGLARLLQEGRIEAAARYGHLNTDTAPGHATVATGTAPRVHGIVLNQWWETGAGGKLGKVYSVSQPEGPGASRLRVPTLADRLREASPGSRVLSLGGKDRAAILLAGKDPRHAVAWFAPTPASFVTSPAYRTGSPEQQALDRALARFAPVFGAEGLAGRYGAVWRKLPVAPGTTAPRVATLPALHQAAVVGIGFDHEIRRSDRSFGDAFQHTPFQDTLLADLAEALLQDPELALGRRGVGDVLFLSFAAHDYIAHAYGAESEESLESIRRLDVTLGGLLDTLDAAIPKDRLVVALTADHGFAPLPEAATPRGARLDPKAFRTALNAALAARLCLDPSAAPIGAMAGWGVYYDHSVLPLRTRDGKCGKSGRPVGIPQLDEAVVPAALEAARGTLAAALPIRRRALWTVAQPIRAAAHDAAFAGRSADVFLIPKAGTILDDVPGKGSNHGSNHDYDARVPLILRGGPFQAGTSKAPSSPAMIVPALAEWFEITMPGVVEPASVELEPGLPPPN